MRIKNSLLGSVAAGVIATALSTSAVFAGAMPAGYADDEGYTEGSYQPLPDRQYEDGGDLQSFGIPAEPVPVAAAAEPEPAEMPAPAPFAAALGNVGALESPCATDQTNEDNPTLRSELDQVLASPQDDFSAGCGNGVNVADIDGGLDPNPGGGGGNGPDNGPSSLVSVGAITAGGTALSGGDPSEIDSLLSLSVGDAGEDASAQRPSLVEVTVGDNFLFGENTQSDPINITLLDAINGDGESAPDGGTSATPLDALLDPVNSGTGEPGLLWLDLSGRPTTTTEPNFDGLVEANLGSDEDPTGFNLVQVDAFDDAMTGGIGQVTVGDGLLDEGNGTIADGDLGDNLVGVTLGTDPTSNENDNLAQVTLDNAGFDDLGTALGISSVEVVNPTELQNGTMELATLAEINGDESGALAPIASAFQFADGSTDNTGGETTSPTGTPIDAVLAPLADAGASSGSSSPALPATLSPDQLASLSSDGEVLPGTESLMLDPAALVGLLDGSSTADASLLDSVVGLLGLGVTTAN